MSRPLDYELPDGLVARYPATPRDHSRLMAVDRASGERTHHRFFELDSLLRPGDLLIGNDTRVIPARLFGEQEGGRRFEVFLLEALDSQWRCWSCLARPGKKVRGPALLSFPHGVRGELTRDGDLFRVELQGPATREAILSWLEKAGKPGLPPYLKRPATDEDRQAYQTIFAREDGSVAAPTAGLHFTPELLERLKAKGIGFAHVTLHVGYGTFAPLPTDAETRGLHEEAYAVPASLWARIDDARKQGGRVIAVGTTSLRALESARLGGNTGRTRLYIRPGHRFGPIDGLITNFHLPGSSLLALVAAFLGEEATRQAYLNAVQERYRFYSYGDAMLILQDRSRP